MESPQMYDLSDSVVKPANFNGLSNKSRLNGSYGEDFAELADLGASEVSLDLQAFVNDPHFSDGIFTDIVEGKGLGTSVSQAGMGGRVSLPPASCAGLTYPSPTGMGYLQPMGYSVPRLGGGETTIMPPVKKDPDAGDFTACRQPVPPAFGAAGGYNPAYASLTPVTSAPGLVPARLPPPVANNINRPPSSKHSSSKRILPGSDEYRRRRERNNVAVRKSREKAKQRCRETEDRVKFLSRENEGLHKRVEIMTKELNVLKNLFANVGVLPDQLQREIAKHLGDGFARPQPAAGL